MAGLGLTMFTRWIPVYRACVAADHAPGRTAEQNFPAKRAFPGPVVAGHGQLAGATFILVLLTILTG